MRTGILNFGKNAILWLSIFFIGFLCLVSLVSTTYFNAETSRAEHPRYRMDGLHWNLLFLILFFLFLCFLNRKKLLERISVKILAFIAVCFVVGVSLLWVAVSHTYPEADQKAVSWMAWLMSQNNFLYFEHGKYMQIYPNQLGLAAILDLLYRLLGSENWKAFMYLTALSNGAVVYLLYRITDRLFSKKRISNLVLLLSMGCIQIMLYTTFLYGITLGLALALASFLCLLQYQASAKKRKKQICYVILSGVFIGAAILVKNNYSIFLVAMILLLLYKTLEQKKLHYISAAAVLVLVTAFMAKGLTVFYEARSGTEISSGMTKSLWVAMGMQEGERAEGWYNEFNYNTFLDTDCDPVKSDAIAKESIKESLQRLAADPEYALSFYYKKTVSQWNEPTYEALWVNQFHKGNFSTIVQSIYDGKLYMVLHEYMNLYQSLIFTAVLICLLTRKREWNPNQLFFALVILGGFVFHTLWEAKSQYIFPYFVILLPYGAAGISDCLDKMALEWRKLRNLPG